MFNCFLTEARGTWIGSKT
jgi:hypothetical protein